METTSEAMKNIYEFASLYDRQYQYYRDDLSFYVDLANNYGSPILELGAGTARVSLALAKAGHRVVGIEYSNDMLRIAQEKIKSLEHLISLQQDDMRSLQLNQTFPLVIAPFNTLMHAYTLSDQDATLTTVKQHLDEGGLFAFDLFNPNFKHLNTLRREKEWEHLGSENAELFIYQTVDEDNQILESRYYLDRIEDGILKRQIALLKQRYYTRFEVERMLKQAGFKHIQIYGDFDKQRYTTQAPHMIVLAKS